MKAIIPVAGYGTRLKPHTDSIQKCLLPVGGKPVLEHILKPLISIGIDEIVLIIGHFGEQVIEFAKQYPHINFRFIEQKKRLGLGHAVYQGLSQTPDPALVVLGDGIFELDYERFISSGRNIIGVEEVPDPQRFGIIETDDDRITNLLEKPSNPPTNLAIMGIYYFTSQQNLFDQLDYLISNDIRTRNEYQLTDAMQLLNEKGYEITYQRIDNCLDCGIPETMLSTNRVLLTRAGRNAIADDAQIINSQLTTCHLSARCIVENSQLDNVIMLEGSVIKNAELSNQIVGVGEIIEG